MQGKSVFFVLLWVIGGLGGDCGRGPIGRVNQSERLQLFGKTSKLAKIKTSTTVTTAATTTTSTATATATATTATPVSGNTANVVAAVPRSGAIAIPLKNIAPRLTSAVVLLSTLTAAIGYFGLPALITVIIISQTIMSFETDSVVSRTIYPEDGGGEKTVPWLRAQKWMWFFGVFAGVTLPILLEEFGQEEMLLVSEAISKAMPLEHSFVVRFFSHIRILHSSAGAYNFLLNFSGCTLHPHCFLRQSPILSRDAGNLPQTPRACFDDDIHDCLFPHPVRNDGQDSQLVWHQVCCHPCASHRNQ